MHYKRRASARPRATVVPALPSGSHLPGRSQYAVVLHHLSSSISTHLYATLYCRIGTTYRLLTVIVHETDSNWLQECSSNGCEVVLSSTNTSHVLQPCDQRANKTSNTSIRDIRDECNKSVVVQKRGVKFNLMCVVHAFEAVTVGNMRQSFQKTGLFPFDENFPNQTKTDL